MAGSLVGLGDGESGGAAVGGGDADGLGLGVGGTDGAGLGTGVGVTPGPAQAASPTPIEPATIARSRSRLEMRVWNVG